ncbi:MAG: alpha-glucosidase C-terminal domain-containing protein [Treponema sp.]|nr:alpha-glucosidase C-terminal domain-containing protein [Treponema sp.]
MNSDCGMDMGDRIFYHIYPLGFCGAPERNDFSCPAGPGLRSLLSHIPRLEELGVNALYLGPLFESTAHGYDTLDYYHVDRRLGNNGDLKTLVRAFQDRGFKVILDGVFNHVGRHFFAFRDLAEKRQASAYRDWFYRLDFNGSSPLGDPFSYEGWNGCYDLVKLNGPSRSVREHLFGAVRFWIEEFGIDGLRLDAADQLLPDFMDELSTRCKEIKRDFWLMGEVVHGDYRNWAGEGRLDSVTNYELYKSLWSSFNDRNFYELSWSLKRQSGPEGIYRNLKLYTFADNHDVNRAASVLRTHAHLFPLYGLLFTMPGIPSIYYGSERGIRGKKGNHSDSALRPAWESSDERLPPENRPAAGSKALPGAIRDFIRIRRENPALRDGDYRELLTAHEQLAFLRECHDGQAVIVAVNSGESRKTIAIQGNLPEGTSRTRWRDLLSGAEFYSHEGRLTLPLESSWLRILKRE